MKSVATLFLALAGASVVVAQGLNSCATDCTNRVVAQGTSAPFNCGADDKKCLCGNPNFWYGIRDCASQVPCGEQEVSAVLAWGNEFCKDAGTALNTGTLAPAESTPSGSASATETGPSTVVNPISTETFTSTISSDGSAVSTVTGETTILSTDLVSTSALVTTVSESDTTFTSTTGFTTVTTEAPTETSENGPQSTSSSSALGAQITAAPVMGFLAAAGLAAALL
ncbi:hypothetical protein QBC38DRAFT_480496 [Podospora fimiseda]|uniref:CFEM domain-containing protein n=1 Tax=Podospora fimiseda TaxID=252190 RepID=A0AAN7BP08_9PEZI|nr:hypothetical protein QBC38DRAFT_480496 [Podospora fimiseda]